MDDDLYRRLRIAAFETRTSCRIAAQGRDPSAYAVTIYTRRELVAKQLDGAFRVESPALRPHYLQARALLDQFSEVEVVWQHGGGIKALLGL